MDGEGGFVTGGCGVLFVLLSLFWVVVGPCVCVCACVYSFLFVLSGGI